jgi:5-methylcytosine-specific restriction protein A
MKKLISTAKPKERRSPKWPKLRAAFLKKNPKCALCGGKKKLNVHHVRPFHLQPDLELSEGNLITLCENKGDGVNCHLLFGHLGNFRSYNPDVRRDVATWRCKLENRP